MFTMLGFSVGLLAVAVEPEGAQAHATGYCGHGTKSGSVAGPYGHMEYREQYVAGWGAGPHHHSYNTFVWNGYRWVKVHSHSRSCLNTHPI